MRTWDDERLSTFWEKTREWCAFSKLPLPEIDFDARLADIERLG
jgi:hypothetical protein